MMLRLLPVVTVLALFAVGCSNDPYETAPVSGQITLDGKPVEKVAIMFQPIATDGHLNPGPGSYGITDANGHYSLKLIGKETRGVVVGKHKIRIENYTEPDDPTNDKPRRRAKPAVPIPAKYYAVNPTLEFDVPPK